MRILKQQKINVFSLSKIFLLLSVIIHVIFILSLVFGFLNPLFHDTTYRQGQGCDFFAIYQAGYNVLLGKNPYETYPGYNVVPYAYDFVYTPFLAFTMGVIFNIFPPFIAYWVWVSLLLSLIWLSCFLTHKICRSLNKPKWVEYVAIGMWLCFSPVYVELFMGQITLIVGLLTFFSLYAEMKKREGQGVIFLTLACLIKQMPLFLMPSFLSSGRTRKVIINVFVFTITLFSFSIIYFFYFLDYATVRSNKLYTHYGNFDFRTIIYEIGSLASSNNHWLEDNLIWINILLIVIFFGLSCLATIYSRDYLVSISLFACSYFLTFSGVWEHHYTLLLPFIIILWIRDDSRHKWLLIFLLLAIPTPFLIFELFDCWYFPFSLLYRCSKFIPVLIMFILLLKQAYKNPRNTLFMDSIRDVGNIILNGLKNPDIDKFPNVFMEYND